MILQAAKAKVAAFAVPIIGTLVVVAGLAFWWLWTERNELLAKTALQKQALSNAAQANRENLSTIKAQKAELQWRETKAIERQERARARDQQLAETQSELERAMQDAPECVDQPWPDAVFNIMRRNTVSDPDRVREGAGAEQLRSADTDPGAASTD